MISYTIDRENREGWQPVRLNIPTLDMAEAEVRAMVQEDSRRLRIQRTETQTVLITEHPTKEGK